MTFEPIRIGMIGGGPGAFIGAVHRLCLRMDDAYRLVAGSFSSDPEKSRQTGQELHLDPARVYGTFEEMAKKEAALPESERIEAVSIVTPNHVHYGPAKLFLNAGCHVICDKPLTLTAEEASELVKLARDRQKTFCVTHNYTGYPIVREARDLVTSGQLGKIRKVYVEYLQGWLADKLEETGQKQASWRTDPKRSGACGAMGDIGTHAENLVEHITGERITDLFAVLHTFVEGRALDDDGMVLFKLQGGGTGTLSASQVCVGCENGLAIRVFGEKGGIEWHQEHPNDLKVTWKDRAPEIRRPGNPWTTADSQGLTRIPPGHPEGYLEGFANLYRAAAQAIRNPNEKPGFFPTAEDGLRGMQFLEAVVQSHQEGRWVSLP